MDKHEILEFEKNPHLELCLKVRRWDDSAKVQGIKTPPFSHYLPVLQRLV
jgi:predicted HD phosphohydrolase